MEKSKPIREEIDWHGIGLKRYQNGDRLPAERLGTKHDDFCHAVGYINGMADDVRKLLSMAQTTALVANPKRFTNQPNLSGDYSKITGLSADMMAATWKANKSVLDAMREHDVKIAEYEAVIKIVQFIDSQTENSIDGPELVKEFFRSIGNPLSEKFIDEKYKELTCVRS